VSGALVYRQPGVQGRKANGQYAGKVIAPPVVATGTAGREAKRPRTLGEVVPVPAPSRAARGNALVKRAPPPSPRKVIGR
jgi:hypothetical protein